MIVFQRQTTTIFLAVLFLLQLIPTVDAATAADIKQLESAVKNGNLKAVNAALSKGVPPNGVPGRSSPLHWAIRKRLPKMVEVLIEAGANVNAKDQWGNTPLTSAQRAHSNAEKLKRDLAPTNAILALLAKTGKATDGKTPLLRAVEAGDLAEVNKLITSKADVNAVGPLLTAPIHTACNKGHIEILKALIDAGANLNQADSRGARPFDLAANADIANTLIANGAKISQDLRVNMVLRDRIDIVRALVVDKKRAKDTDCALLLLVAIGYRKIDIIKMILEERGNELLQMKHPEFPPPLHLAIGPSPHDMAGAESRNRQMKILELLLEKGANINALNTKKQTPLDAARGSRLKDLLIKAGGKPASELPKY